MAAPNPSALAYGAICFGARHDADRERDWPATHAARNFVPISKQISDAGKPLTRHPAFQLIRRKA